MNYVIVKIRAKKEDGLRKLFAVEERLYDIPENLTTAVKYDPSRLLEEDEWYVLTDFSKTNYCLDILKSEFRSIDYAAMSKTDVDIIEYLFSYQDGVYFFQRIFKNSILKQKRITLGDNVKLEQPTKSIVINELPDAIYCKDKDALYFKKLQTIAPIFRGVEELYKEATDEEIEGFLKNEFIETVDGYGLDKIKAMNRKRISLAITILNKFNKKQKEEVLEYTHNYYPQIKYENGTFSLANEDDMKYLLWGIGERYYTTPVTNEARVANSVMTLSNS